MRPIRTVVHSVLAAALAGAAFRIFLSHRGDYAGHFLAGFGTTLILLTPLALLHRTFPRLKVIVVVLAIFAGGVLEASVFRYAIFDPVDFANQSLGAAMAGAALVGRRGSAATGFLSACVGAVFVLAGFFYAFR